ncbi:hypothetical protein ACFX1X_042871 [Malus domestica]
MKANKATVLTFAKKCKSILSSNWQGQLNTIKVDAKGSKDDIYRSKVKYICKRGKLYLWVPENELHNVEKDTNPGKYRLNPTFISHPILIILLHTWNTCHNNSSNQQEGDLDAIQELLDSCTNVDFIDIDGCTALHVAAY